MSDTEAQLFARLKEEHSDFRRLAEKHREYDIKIGEFDRIYYLTSEQERKRKELQKLKLKIKDEMYVIMRQFQHATQERGCLILTVSARRIWWMSAPSPRRIVRPSRADS